MTKQEALALARAKWGDTAYTEESSRHFEVGRFIRRDGKEYYDGTFSYDFQPDHSWESVCLAAGLLDVPCRQCGKTPEALHYNRLCPDCFDPQAEER